MLLLTFLLCGAVLGEARWSAKTHEEEVILLSNIKKKEAFSPDLKGLDTLLSSQDKDASFRHVCFWNYLESNTIIQSELMESFKANYPLELKAALDSAGNMHNPKVISLRKVFSECLLKTPSVQKIDALFRKRGYTVSSVSCEKFRIDKTTDQFRFKAITWLIITKAEDAAHDS